MKLRPQDKSHRPKDDYAVIRCTVEQFDAIKTMVKIFDSLVASSETSEAIIKMLEEQERDIVR